MRTSIALALALLAAPAVGGAESLAVTEAAAISPGIEKSDVAKVRALFEQALRETGIEVAGRGTKGRNAEFVASLTLAKEGTDVILTAQVSRLRIDLWAARSEVRVQEATEAAVAAAVQDLAGQVTLAVQTAPARNTTQPSARPPARKLERKLAVPAVGKKGAAATPASAPAAEPVPVAE